ncbi:MAG TPA: hypothetical protein PKN21_09975 [Bacteroidales bacterium]|nr:hypothetical protein [Bacteroidales bacterium]
MKTTKFITTISTLTFIFFMSVTSIANSFTTGDGGKTSASRISVLKDMISDAAASATAETEFSNLRFDVNRFINDGAEAEMMSELQNQVRFDVNSYSVNIPSDNELPAVTDFGYLRFDASAYSNADISEMPASEYNYLKFDVNSFAAHNPVPADVMPEVR